MEGKNKGKGNEGKNRQHIPVTPPEQGNKKIKRCRKANNALEKNGEKEECEGWVTIIRGVRPIYASRNKKGEPGLKERGKSAGKGGKRTLERQYGRKTACRTGNITGKRGKKKGKRKELSASHRPGEKCRSSKKSAKRGTQKTWVF